MGLLAMVVLALTPGVAAAQQPQCPEASPSYTDACGPTFVQPGWGDAGGWTDPSQYATIQLADVNGDGTDELIGRSDRGLEIHWFDTSVGQWRPQVDGNAVQQVLTDLRSPLPSETPATDWTKPQYFSTIQAANVDGQPGAEILARAADGIRVYKYTPPTGTDIDGGTWRKIGTGGPFSDAGGYDDASLYLTIKAADIDGDGKAELMARTHAGVVAFEWNGSGWSAGLTLSGVFGDPACAVPTCYLDFRAGDLLGTGTGALIGRDSYVSAWLLQGPSSALGWGRLSVGSASSLFFADQNPSNDCPFGGTGAGSGDCLGSSPSYYETLQAADIDGTPGDELLARASDGLRVKQSSEGWSTIDDTDPLVRYGPGWTRQSGVAGDYNETETQGTGQALVRFAGTAVQVIAPKGPDLGTINIQVDGPETGGTFDLSAPSRQAQQVIYTARGLPLEPHRLYITGTNAAIDAIKLSKGLSWRALPTLGDLAGAASDWSSTPGKWASIQTANLDGKGGKEVLALDGTGLQAWSFNADANAWSKLAPSTPLTLSGDWLTHPEYYSTIHAGDVDGDGRDEVIARGPYGIRTWFYRTGGWERYTPYGYAAFATPGRQAAFVKLNSLALANGAITSGEIRDVWTDVGDTPDTGVLATTLTTLQQSLGGSLVGNCSNESNLAPPTYGACTPPAGSTGFSADDWRTVVNELLSEAWSAEQVANQYSNLKAIRDGVFESESGALPTIDDDLQLAGAAGNTADFSLQAFFSITTGIAGSLAGLSDPLAGAGLAIASYLFSALPSASTTATSSFQTTYAGLETKLTTARDEMSDAWASQLQQALGDQGLLDLVAQLRARGTWKLDIGAMIGASREAFVLHTYQALLPTIYTRYAVTDCTPNSGTDRSDEAPNCVNLPSGPYVANSSASTATWLGPGLNWNSIVNGYPCPNLNGVGIQECNYGQTPGTMPGSITGIVFGAIASTCSNQPGNANAVWHFSCSLGVPTSMIGADAPGWSFTTLTGSPVIYAPCSWCSVSAVARASAARTGSSAVAARAGSSRRSSRDVLGRLRFTGRVPLSRALRLDRMRVVFERTLYEHGRREELARATRTRRLRPFALRHVRGGLFVSRRSSRPRVRLQLRRFGDGTSARVDLRLTRIRTRDIRAVCGVLPARVGRAGRPLELSTRLRLRDGAQTGRISVRQHWRCVRDRKGEFVGIRPIKPRRLTERPGLAVRLGTPRLLASGRRAAVPVTVVNQRGRRPSRVVSSLWHLRITGTAGGTPRTIGVNELRARRSRRLRLSVPVPRTARGRVCVQVIAGADSARPARVRRCVQGAGGPQFAG